MEKKAFVIGEHVHNLIVEDVNCPNCGFDVVIFGTDCYKNEDGLGIECMNMDESQCDWSIHIQKGYSREQIRELWNSNRINEIEVKD